MSTATGTFGTLTDYNSGLAIRPATAAEWRRTADLVNGSMPGSYTGAWEDENGRAVWVADGPEITVTENDILELEQEAATAGDAAQAALCRQVWTLDEDGNYGADSRDARAECVRVILDSRLNAAGE